MSRGLGLKSTENSESSNLTKPPRMQSIARPRIRNLVRGILSSTDHSGTKEIMNNLRREARPSEMRTAIEIILRSPAGLRLFSPKLKVLTLDDVRQRPFYRTADLDVEVSNQLAKLSLNVDDAVASIRDLRRVDDAFFSGDAEQFSARIVDHIDRHGLSLAVMRKAISSRYTRIATNPGYNLTSAMKAFLGGRRFIVAAAVDDTCDWERSYAEARRKYVDLISSRRIRGSSAFLIQDLFSLENGDIANALQAHGKWSALDLCEFMHWIRKGPHVNREASSQMTMPKEIEKALHECFSGDRLDSLLEMVTDEQDLQDYSSLPHLPAWRQYQDIAGFKVSVEERISDRLSGVFPAKKWPTDPSLPESSSLTHLVEIWRSRTSTGGREGMLHRTLELLPHVIKPGAELKTDGEVLLSVLNNTVDVARLASTEEIRSRWKPSPDDHLYNYLRCALLCDSDGGELTRHAFRRALQTLATSAFDGSILELFRYLDRDSKHVSEHLFSQCTEGFLTELYHIYPKSEDVINAQIELYEYYGDIRKDGAATDIARAQKLNLRLRRVRGTLDDTRLYVDPLKFVQWGLDKLAPALREFAAIKHLLNTASPVPVSGPEDISTLEDNRARFASVLGVAFQEFCENKFYGIESYVGRRIRHGTLTGMLVDEMRHEVDACIADCMQRAPNFANHVRRWLTNLDSKVRILGERHLYVRTKEKPEGVIASSADSPEKRAVLQTMERRTLSALEPNQPVSQAVAVIYEYCWQLVECDLVRARKLINTVGTSSVIDPADHIGNLSDSTSDMVMKWCRHLNTALRDRCETISSWLTRPSSASPSASFDQILQVVLEEVLVRFPKSNPIVTYSGSTSLDVFGHRFHAIYDILYILVDNAARHGMSNGTLLFSVDVVEVTMERKTVRVSLKSDLDQPRSRGAREAIEQALSADLDDALITEGGSGIRKVRRLVQEYAEFDSFLVNFQDHSVEFSVDIYLHV